MSKINQDQCGPCQILTLGRKHELYTKKTHIFVRISKKLLFSQNVFPPYEAINEKLFSSYIFEYFTLVYYIFLTKPRFDILNMKIKSQADGKTCCLNSKASFLV